MRFTLLIDIEKDEEILATVHRRSQLTDQIEQLVLQHTGSDRIPAYTEDDMKMLSFQDIECITVSQGKTLAIAADGTQYRLKMRLYELEALLPGCFIRINKSAIANETRLECFRASFNGAVDAVFKSGYSEYVSRRCFAQIKRRFDER